MKYLLSLFVVFGFYQVDATDLGKEIIPDIDSQGKPNIGMQYAYDDVYSWTLLIKSNLSQNEISKLPPKLYWALMNLKTNEVYQSWIEMGKFDVFMTQYNVREAKDVLRFLPNMKDSAILISVDQNAILYNINLGNICRSYPTHINDLTNSDIPKCAVNL